MESKIKSAQAQETGSELVQMAEFGLTKGAELPTTDLLPITYLDEHNASLSALFEN